MRVRLLFVILLTGCSTTFLVGWHVDTAPGTTVQVVPVVRGGAMVFGNPARCTILSRAVFHSAKPLLACDQTQKAIITENPLDVVFWIFEMGAPSAAIGLGVTVPVDVGVVGDQLACEAIRLSIPRTPSEGKTHPCEGPHYLKKRWQPFGVRWVDWQGDVDR